MLAYIQTKKPLPKHFIIWYSWSISESPGNNGSPVNISIIRQPHAQTSTGLYTIEYKRDDKKNATDFIQVFHAWSSKQQIILYNCVFAGDTREFRHILLCYRP